MRQSAEIDKLAVSLAKAQAAFTTVITDREVDFMTKSGMRIHYKYATLPAVMSMIRKPLADNGLSILQPTSGSLITTILSHESGQFISEETPLPNMSDGDIKTFGANVSYIRRYAISSLLGIAVSDEDDEIVADGGITTVSARREHDASANSDLIIVREHDASANKLTRPMSPQQVRDAAIKRTSVSTGPADGAQIEVAWKALLSAVNGDVAFAGDITNFLFGFRALDDTTTSEQVKFLLSWAGATLENGYEPSDHMKNEALWILKQIQTAAGQTEMFSVPDFDDVEEKQF